jgi:hypothetical protein
LVGRWSCYRLPADIDSYIITAHDAFQGERIISTKGACEFTQVMQTLIRQDPNDLYLVIPICPAGGDFTLDKVKVAL